MHDEMPTMQRNADGSVTGVNYAPDTVWHQMKDAPRDGTKILWTYSDGSEQSYCVIHWPIYDDCFTGDGFWCHLPKPPAYKHVCDRCGAKW